MGTTRTLLDRFKDAVCCRTVINEAEQSAPPHAMPTPTLGMLEREVRPLPPPNTQTKHHSFNIPLDELSIGEKVGEGNYAIVYKGIWRGKVVAIKTLTNFSLDSIQWFLEENKMMRHLAKLSLSGVVQYYGSSFFGPVNYRIVMEFLPGPSVAHWLYNHYKKNIHIPWGMRLKVLERTAAHLEDLAKHDIEHRDLKPGHIKLIGDIEKPDFDVKIIDWGYSLIVPADCSIYDETVRGTPAYIAPEMYQGFVSKKSGIYAFAMIMYECAEMKDAYTPAAGKFSSEKKLADATCKKIKDAALQNKRPVFTIFKPEFIDLTKEAWDHNPQKRPNAHTLHERLQRLVENENMLQVHGTFSTPSTSESDLEPPIFHSTPSSSP